MSWSSTPTRRGFIAASGMGLAGLATARHARAQPIPDMNRFAGATIEVNLIKSPRGDTLQKYEKEFEALTGIKVNSEQTPEHAHATGRGLQHAVL